MPNPVLQDVSSHQRAAREGQQAPTAPSISSQLNICSIEPSPPRATPEVLLPAEPPGRRPGTEWELEEGNNKLGNPFQ
eukprot:5731513-Alexandrium_andersonii.AAC.1